VNPTRRYQTLLAALLISGASGLINQIAWQRAVKIYLSNSETLSSMIVVLVFMLGLGVGSLAAAAGSSRLRNPMRALGLIELCLFLANAGLILAFGERLRETTLVMQMAALTAGLSPTVFYAVFSFAVLFVPCFLMGLTIPIAAEAAQRQLRASRSKAVAEFFAMNTLGAVLGTVVCGLVLMPIFGQSAALAVAASGNLLASALILGSLGRLPAAPANTEPSTSWAAQPVHKLLLQNEVVLAFLLGAISLGYEVYLFRILALAYTPLPWIFSFVLCMFLLFWSAGVYIAGKKEVSTTAALALTALSIVVIPLVLSFYRAHIVAFPIWSAGLVFFMPALGFGILFGTTIGRYARQWGRDVGLFTALNTAGSGVGILMMTLLLFERDMSVDAWVLGAGLLVLIPYHAAREGLIPSHKLPSVGTAVVLVAVVYASIVRSGPVLSDRRQVFYGRDGVVEIARDGRVFIGGLWHSVLFRDDDDAMKMTENVRRKMLIALLPFLVHNGHGPKTALNIGMGTGATARTLAKSPQISTVDTYEIVKTLQSVIAMYPEETIGSARLEKLHIYWEDARNGLMTRDKSYDIITQSPLYLSQAGSSFLLSREYLELLRNRLKPGGIAGIYSNARGNSQQALLVRKTVSEVFLYCESFNNGYFILASDSPIQISREAFQAKLDPSDPISRDVQLVGLDWILKGFDAPRLDWSSSPYVITDDHPLVEYPLVTSWLLGKGRN
jgi:spermidine synthase/MFS family permease